MLKIYLLLLASTVLMVHSLSAQQCGTVGVEAEALTARLLQNKARLAADPVQFRSTQYVPIRFHLVTKTDGSGGIRLRNILEQLCGLNKDFATTGIQFYIKDAINFIKNDKLYTDHYNNLNLMEPYRDRSAINVWIVGDIQVGSDPNAVVLGYYTYSRDWLVVLKDEVGSLSCTVSHEMGHFFGLLHTFHGWDADPWSATKHGNPAPAVSPGGIFTEYQNGENCDSAGDFICDTPPDYNFGDYWSDCDYKGGAKDPTGIIVNPTEVNFMGYFFYCQRGMYEFSSNQRNLMFSDAMATNRAYIRHDFTPAYLQFNGMPTLELPLAGANVPFYNNVDLQWSEVEGATRYLVEMDVLPTFTSATLLNYITTSNKITLNNLKPNETYYWRVRPFNENYTCTIFTSRKSFKTNDIATKTHEISQLNQWQVHPNPINAGTSLSLLLDVNKQFEAEVQLRNLTGQLVQSWGIQQFTADQQKHNFTLKNIAAGIYLLTLTTGTERQVQKIIIQ